MDEIFDSSGSDSDSMEGFGAAGPFDHLTDSTLRISSILMDDLFTVSVVLSKNWTTYRPTDWPTCQRNKQTIHTALLASPASRIRVRKGQFWKIRVLGRGSKQKIIISHWQTVKPADECVKVVTRTASPTRKKMKKRREREREREIWFFLFHFNVSNRALQAKCVSHVLSKIRVCALRILKSSSYFWPFI